ncbi:MAG: polyprenyl synthetase family protein [Bordetella sp.]|nr:MAG: polyprenyl synthetase family protein [Bordetella sp.]
MKLSKLISPINEDIKAVDSIIHNRINSKIVLIQKIVKYIIQVGGKRMRPAIMLMIARSLNYEGTNHHLIAAVIELIHTATLLHDDVVDNSDLRRGRNTANNVFGNAPSVLVGDYLYSLSFGMMVEVNSMRIMDVLSTATTTISEGEILQLLNIHDPEVSYERYLKVVRYKTAKLFEAAAQIGAILSSASPEQENSASIYGRHIGTAFQLVDDVLDYKGNANTLGKNLGNDLREGKPTLPLIRVMDIGSINHKKLIRQAIKTGKADFTAIDKAIRETDALEYTMKIAKSEIEIACQAIDSYPESIYKNSLINLCSFAINREF